MMTYNNEASTSLDSWFPPFDPLDATPVADPTPPQDVPADKTDDTRSADDGSHWLLAPPQPVSTDTPRPARRRSVNARALGITAAAVAMTIGVGALAVSAFTSDQDTTPEIEAVSSTPAPTSELPAPTTTTAALAQSWCPESVTDGVVTGAGPGGTTSGSAAILAFEHAYYVERSGAAAREILAPNAQLKSATADELQRGIDTIPAGTEHCVNIRAAAPNTYAVTLEQRYSDGTRTTDKQTISTTDAGGRTFITSIGAAQ
ncbi:hypothetical protein [Rhodococcus sp. 06-1460-1B]|uniref:hypothetical protein n=1 Tax=Rhodococcus sp. 06-1460-1B TaxID=2022501 RepID=UPI000B9A6F7C|nr:hypothetical protein [Rhodococcus sp. 06-1460-1B]OZD68215.1 hypothetical protein CH268_00200 [Rhodococcus sp. 06-1460-1B]